MIKLTFECNKCPLKVICTNPGSTFDQPFCDYCYRPMFLIEAEIKKDSTNDNDYNILIERCKHEDTKPLIIKCLDKAAIDYKNYEFDQWVLALKEVGA